MLPLETNVPSSLSLSLESGVGWHAGLGLGLGAAGEGIPADGILMQEAFTWASSLALAILCVLVKCWPSLVNMVKAHLLPLRLEAPRVLGLQMTSKMGSKEGAERAVPPFVLRRGFQVRRGAGFGVARRRRSFVSGWYAGRLRVLRRCASGW